MLKKQIIVKQFMHETETWNRTLGFIEEENVILKNRISEIVSTITIRDTDLIEKMEEFQDLFVKEDESIQQLKKQINSEDQLLVRDTYEDGNLFRVVCGKQRRLRKQFDTVENKFRKIRNEFNDYLAELPS